MEPRLVMHIQSKIASEQEETRDQAIESGRLQVIVALSHAQRLLHQHGSRDEIRAGQCIQAERIPWNTHARLDHHECTERGQEAVGIDILLGVHGLLFQAATVQDGEGRVHVGKVEFDALLDHVLGQEARRGSQRRTAGRTGDAIEAVRNLGGEGRLALGFTKLADHLRTRALGAFLLWNGMVGTRQLGGRAVATRIDPIALDLSTMAGVAGPLHRGRHAASEAHARSTAEAGRRRRGLGMGKGTRRGGFELGAVEISDTTVQEKGVGATSITYYGAGSVEAREILLESGVWRAVPVAEKSRGWQKRRTAQHFYSVRMLEGAVGGLMRAERGHREGMRGVKVLSRASAELLGQARTLRAREAREA